MKRHCWCEDKAVASIRSSVAVGDGICSGRILRKFSITESCPAFGVDGRKLHSTKYATNHEPEAQLPQAAGAPVLTGCGLHHTDDLWTQAAKSLWCSDGDQRIKSQATRYRSHQMLFGLAVGRLDSKRHDRKENTSNKHCEGFGIGGLDSIRRYSYEHTTIKNSGWTIWHRLTPTSTAEKFGNHRPGSMR